MRYSAATSDPNTFKDDGFTLRQLYYDPPRRTELFIVLTMYNEDEELFCRTMHGVLKNIAHLCTRTRSKTWGKDGWKKVVVCIVSDGRAKINARTLSVIATIGAYQDGIAKVCVWMSGLSQILYSYLLKRTSSTANQLLHTSTSTLRKVCPITIFSQSAETYSIFSFRGPLNEDRRSRERHRTRSSHILSQREEPKENQFPSVVLQRLWTNPPA